MARPQHSNSSSNSLRMTLGAGDGAFVFMHCLATRTLAVLAAIAWATPLPAQTNMSTELDDPYLWLEEVDGARALDFARAASTRTLAELRERAEFFQIRDEVRDVLDSRDRIAQVAVHGDHLYNFWQDRANPRGLWRRTSWAEYRKPQTVWETVLDIDALARSCGDLYGVGNATNMLTFHEPDIASRLRLLQQSLAAFEAAKQARTLA